MGTTEAIRTAMGALGNEAETKAIREYIASHHKEVDTAAPGFASALSQVRKAMRGGKPKGARGRKPGQTTVANFAAPATQSKMPSSQGSTIHVGLRQLKELLGKEGAKKVVDSLLED